MSHVGQASASAIRAVQRYDGRKCGGIPPLGFIARLAALVPKPRVNLTHFHDVFAPDSRGRASVTPAKRGKGAQPRAFEEEQDKTPALNERPLSRHRSLSADRRCAQPTRASQIEAATGRIVLITDAEKPHSPGKQWRYVTCRDPCHAVWRLGYAEERPPFLARRFR